MKIILATNPFSSTEPLVLGWLILMAILISTIPIHIFLTLRRRWTRKFPRRPKASDLLK